MEVGVRLVGFLFRMLDLILFPLFWLYGRRQTPTPTPPTGILLKSVVELAAAVRNGEITSEEIVQTYINRIQEVNPLINAVVEERFNAALEDARHFDREIAEAKKKGNFEEVVKKKPLLGIPFTVKESCSLAGYSNAVGFLDDAGRKATKDGGAIRLLREAGAIPLLVSNTPELCLGWETTNLLKGTTNNPYCLTRTAGGSSGGEGALLGSGSSAFGAGSDIAGSLRVPAAFCGVFGHKPTPGIIPIDEHVPTLEDENYSKYLTVGPMTRKAEDLPLLLQVMAGANSNKFQLDRPVHIKDVKIYYMTEATDSFALTDVEQCIKDRIKAAVTYLQKDCGCTVSEEKFTDLEESVEISISNFFSMKDIPNLMHNRANPKRDKSIVMELVKYVFGCGSRSLQGLGFALIANTRLFIPRYKQPHYHHKAQLLLEQFKRTLGDDGVFLYPVYLGNAHYHNQIFGKASGVLYTMMFNVLGMPSAAVPMGLHKGLPIGIQVAAAPYQDRLCLAIAKQLETGFGGWRPPQ